jgi:hypothetical protein
LNSHLQFPPRRSSRFPSISHRKIKRRPLLTALLTIAALLFLWRNRAFLPFFPFSPNLKPTDPHLSASDLQLSIEPVSSNPPTIRCSITNLHPSTSASLLIWNTPLDPDALHLGIFNITDLSTSLPATLTLVPRAPDRPTQPPNDAFWYLEPRHAVTKDVVLQAENFELQKGREYEVQAKGRWKAVWRVGVGDQSAERLRKWGIGMGVLRGEFESEKARIKVG